MADTVPSVLAGIAGGLAIAGGAIVSGVDPHRRFYPTVLIAIAAFYVVFAAMGAPRSILVMESIVAGAFVLLAGLGFRATMWLVVAGIAAHGVFDLGHDRFIDNPGVPSWWRPFCGSLDVTLAAALASILKSPAQEK